MRTIVDLWTRLDKKCCSILRIHTTNSSFSSVFFSFFVSSCIFLPTRPSYVKKRFVLSRSNIHLLLHEGVQCLSPDSQCCDTSSWLFIHFRNGNSIFSVSSLTLREGYRVFCFPPAGIPFRDCQTVPFSLTTRKNSFYCFRRTGVNSRKNYSTVLNVG